MDSRMILGLCCFSVLSVRSCSVVLMRLSGVESV